MGKRDIRVTYNKQKRVFTIKTYDGGSLMCRFKTLPFSKEEAEAMLNNTEEDWRVFLRTSDFYYEVK